MATFEASPPHRTESFLDRLYARLQALDEGVLFVDPEGSVAGPQTDETQSSSPSPLQRRDGSLFPIQEHPAVIALRTGRSVRGVELGVRAADGEVKWRIITADPVYDRERLTGIVVSSSAAHERKVERALLASHARVASAAHALARLDELTSRLWAAATLEEGLELILSATVEFLRADMGSVRLVDEGARVMRIAAQHGFSNAFLERFGELSIPLDSEWGRAAHNAVVVVDVEADPHYTAFLDIARSAGYRALQSTPLFGRGGALVGILLTHFRAPHRPSAEELRRLDVYARQAAAFIERCQGEARMRESEGRLRLALQASSSATWRWNSATNELDWDDAFHAHYGFGRSEPGGFDAWVARLHPDDRARVLERLDWFRNAANGELVELDFRSVRSDGRVVWHHVVGRMETRADGMKGMTGIDLDVSERRVTDAELADARARLAIIQQRAPFAIALKRMADGALISANEAFLQLFELTPEGTLGKTCLELGILDLDTHLQIDKPLRERRAVHNLQLRRRTRSGAERFLTLNWDPVTITGHEYVVATALDLTAVKRAEQAISENEARHEYLVALNDALRPLTDPVAVQVAATALLGERLGVSRVVYGEIIGEREMVVHRDYVKGVASIAGRHQLDTFGEALVAASKGGETVVVEDIANDPRLAPSVRDTYRALECGAFMASHLVKDGRLVATLGVNSTNPRVWTALEIDLLNETAERTWAAVERAHTDRLLRDNEARLRLALEASQASSWSWCGTTDKATWDDRFRVQYGLPADGPQTRAAWIARIHQDDRPRIVARIAEMQRGEGGDAWNVEFRASRPDGTTVWFHSIGRAEREPDGQLKSVVGIQLDITERKHAEAELGAVSELLAAIHHDAPIAITVSRRSDGRFVSVNDEFTRLLGWSREEALGKTSIELGIWTPEERERVVGHVRRGEHVRNVEVINRTKAGEDRIVSASFVPLALNDGEYMLAAVRDVSEEKRAHAEIEEHRRKEQEQSRMLQTLLETAAQGIMSVDRAGIIVQTNAALETMMGYDRGELVGRPASTLVVPEAREGHMRRFAQVWEKPTSRILDIPEGFYGLRKDGTTIPIEASVTLVPTSTGGLLYSFVTDVTESRRTQRTLETYTRELEYRASQLRRLASALTLAEQHANERLARRLHGNLQQLLASGQSTLDLFTRRMADRVGSEADLLDLIRRSLDEAVAETRALARELFPQQLHRDGLAVGLKWQAAWFQEKLGLHVNLSWDPDADPDQRHVRALLFESVRELLFNAAKHAHVEHVNVRLELTPDDQIRVLVADDGVGFDPAAAFGPSDERKTGLGLFSISERIALIGGRLEVDAAPGAGARFTLQVPRTSDEVGWEDTTPPNRASRGADAAPRRIETMPLSVLIVDDHALVRHGLRLLFETRPELRIIGEATNGSEAVVQARALRPDAIVMDVSMPEMDGIEATRRIHGELPEIEIIGLSAQERTEPIHPIQRAGASGLFTKGQDGELLMAHLLAVHERTVKAAERKS